MDVPREIVDAVKDAMETTNRHAPGSARFSPSDFATDLVGALEANDMTIVKIRDAR